MQYQFSHEEYKVQAPDDHSVKLARRVELVDQSIAWFDESGHERVMEVAKVLKADSECFVFERADAAGGVYELTVNHAE